MNLAFFVQYFVFFVVKKIQDHGEHKEKYSTKYTKTRLGCYIRIVGLVFKFTLRLFDKLRAQGVFNTPATPVWSEQYFRSVAWFRHLASPPPAWI